MDTGFPLVTITGAPSPGVELRLDPESRSYSLCPRAEFARLRPGAEPRG